MKYTNTARKSGKRIVLDTNVLVSGLLWTDPPHDLICMAEEGEIELYTSLEILDELEEVLRRNRFQHRIATLDTNVEELMNRVRLLVNLVEIELSDKPIIHEDPDDDMFLVCCGKDLKGAMNVLMTDGVIEAQNSKGQMYSDSGRLEETISKFTVALSAEAMVEAILNDAMNFGGDKAQRDDDMTVVVAKME